MKRFFFFIGLLFIIGFIFFQCKSTAKENHEIEIKLGWVDDHTLVVEGYGYPNKDTTGFVRRRGTAKKNALNDARNNASIQLMNKSYKKIKKSNVIELIESGHIIKTEYNQKDECKLNYIIQTEHLKKIAEHWNGRNYSTTQSTKQKLPEKPDLIEKKENEIRSFEPDDE